MSDQLTIRSILGALAGVVFGWVAGLFFPQIMIHTSFPAALFEHALQLLVAPLLVTAVIVGVAAFGDMAKVGRSFSKLLLYLFGTGAIAALLALGATLLFQPGKNMLMAGQAGTMQFDQATSYTLGNVLQGIIPFNLPGSISAGYFTGLVLFAFAIGFFLIQAGFRGKPFTDIVALFLSLQKKIFQVLVYVLPVGLFFIIGSAVANNAESFTTSLNAISAIFPLLLVTLLVFALVVLPGIQWFVTGEMPLSYFLNVQPAMAAAFATGSTTTAFPILYECVSEQQDDNRVTGTALPFGLLLSTHGSTILTVMLTVFTAQAVGASLGVWQILMLLFVAIVVPVGIVGFPAAQLVLFGALFHLFQFPAEAYALLAVIWSGDWLLNRLTAPVNTLSSAVGAAVVAGSFDLKTARHTAPPSRPSGQYRSDDQRRRGNYQSDQRGERRYRDDRSPDRERTPSHAGGGADRPRQGGPGRDRGERFDRNKPREGRGERSGYAGRGPERSENRPNRFQNNRDDRRRFPQDRPNRDVPTESTPEPTQEREPVMHTPEPQRETRTFTPPAVEKTEKPVEQNQDSQNVSYGRAKFNPRQKPERENSTPDTDSFAGSENKAKEPDFPASGDVSYGRSRRRPDFVKNEPSAESTASTSSEEESVVSGEVSFGRGRRRPPGR